jgi:hypothetical protein
MVALPGGCLRASTGGSGQPPWQSLCRSRDADQLQHPVHRWTPTCLAQTQHLKRDCRLNNVATGSRRFSHVAISHETSFVAPMPLLAASSHIPAEALGMAAMQPATRCVKYVAPLCSIGRSSAPTRSSAEGRLHCCRPYYRRKREAGLQKDANSFVRLHRLHGIP